MTEPVESLEDMMGILACSKRSEATDFMQAVFLEANNTGDGWMGGKEEVVQCGKPKVTRVRCFETGNGGVL